MGRSPRASARRCRKSVSMTEQAGNCCPARSWITPFRAPVVCPHSPASSARCIRPAIRSACALAAKAAPRPRSRSGSTRSWMRSRSSGSSIWRCRSPPSGYGRHWRTRVAPRRQRKSCDSILTKDFPPREQEASGFAQAAFTPIKSTVGAKRMANEIVTAHRGPVLEITLNRPEIGNAASDAMAVELTKLLLSAGESAEIVVLRGAGEDFCVGRESMGKRPPGAPPEALELRRRNDVVFNCYGAFRRCEIPVIGVVKGRAFGFGCAIAAVCDITLAADTANFQVPEMAHNIMPTMVMSALVDRVPRKAMTYLVWSTAVIGPQQAREAGIASAVIPAAELDAAVDALCKQIMAAPRPARVGCKDYARAALDMDVGGAIEFARSIHAVINSSSEMLPQEHK